MTIRPTMEVRYRLAQIRRSLSHVKQKMAAGKPASPAVLGVDERDENGYRRIAELIPNLQSYKETTRGHLRRRGAAMGCSNLNEYYVYLLDHDDELENLKSNLTLIGTNFFRGDNWDYFRESCLAQLRDKDIVKIWCAACSSGKEVYSTILCLVDYVPPERIHVLATDYNPQMVEACQRAVYSWWELDTIPHRYLKHVELYRGRHLGAEGPSFTFTQRIKAAVTTENIDLLTDAYPRGFDVILCRNVLKFFEPNTIPKVQEKLVASLNEGGFLFLATDDNHKGKELLKNPESLGVMQMDGHCIYRKVAPR